MPFVDGKWIPNKKQEQFLALPFSIREAFYGGGAGGGKTEVLLVYPIIHRWYENSRFKQLFLRRTYPELRNEVVQRSHEFYEPLGGEYNKSTMTWTFPSGAMIFFGHCEDENDVHKYDSMEINLFTPDELTSDTEFIYLYIGFTRVRSSDRNLPAIIRAAGMPGGIGHTWVKKRFIEPCKTGYQIIEGKGGNRRIFIPALLADNPNIDPGYNQSLDALPEAERQAKKFGSWDSYLGSVFDEFRDRHYPDEPDNALHVIEPFEIPEWWPKIVAIDWGYSALTYVSYGAISPEKKVYVYREQAWQKTKIEEWAAYVKEWIELENPRVIKICRSAGQDRGQEHTILEQVTTALGRAIEMVNNAPGTRVAGKLLLHEYLRWKEKYVPLAPVQTYNGEYAEWILRNRTSREYDSYLASFIPAEPETNLPKLQIFNTCPLLIDAIKTCSYDKTHPEDVAEFAGDDPYDAIRYLVDTCEKYFTESEDEFLKIQKRERLLIELNTTQDMTRFYRNMRTLESDVTSPRAVGRYHSKRVH